MAKTKRISSMLLTLCITVVMFAAIGLVMPVTVHAAVVEVGPGVPNAWPNFSYNDGDVIELTGNVIGNLTIDKTNVTIKSKNGSHFTITGHLVVNSNTTLTLENVTVDETGNSIGVQFSSGGTLRLAGSCAVSTKDHRAVFFNGNGSVELVGSATATMSTDASVYEGLDASGTLSINVGAGSLAVSGGTERGNGINSNLDMTINVTTGSLVATGYGNTRNGIRCGGTATLNIGTGSVTTQSLDDFNVERLCGMDVVNDLNITIARGGSLRALSSGAATGSQGHGIRVGTGNANITCDGTLYAAADALDNAPNATWANGLHVAAGNLTFSGSPQAVSFIPATRVTGPEQYAIYVAGTITDNSGIGLVSGSIDAFLYTAPTPTPTPAATNPEEEYWQGVLGQLAATGANGRLTVDATNQNFVPYYILQHLDLNSGKTITIKTSLGTFVLTRARLLAAGIDVDNSYTFEHLKAAGLLAGGSPQTGDSSNIPLWALCGGLAFAGLALCGLSQRKRIGRKTG